MLRIMVPSTLGVSEVAFFFENTLNEIRFLQPKEICFDFTNLFFIKPPGVVTLWNMVDYIERVLGVEIYYTIPPGYKDKPRDFRAVDYLDDSLFFDKVMGKKQHAGSRPRSTTNGLEKLEHGKYNAAYIRNTMDWLKGNIHLRKKSFGALEIALGEAFNNINDHSGSEIGGCAFAQHYPSYKSISFSIADAGVGIPTRIRTKFTTDHQGNDLALDSAAMKFASQAKVTTESTPGNRGMGLDNLLHIIENNNGSMAILSNKSKLTYNKSQKLQVSDLDHSYNGTLMMLNFRTDTLDIDEEEDLEWL